MNIQGYQKLSLLDFPEKTACTIFTGGCNLRCPFCHNASLVRTPFEVPNKETEVLEYLSRRRGLLDGVCVTGGEPLLQPDLTAFTAKLKAMGYLVKLDTNGTLPDRLRALLATGTIDYVAMDVKSSLDGYAVAVGCETNTQKIMESIRLIQSSGIAHEFRTTAVKGIHTPADIEAIARLIGPHSPYFIQGFVDSGNLLGAGCSAFTETESEQLLSSAKKHNSLSRLRGST